MKDEKSQKLLYDVISLVALIVLLIVFLLSLDGGYTVSGQSMKPTLNPGDKVYTDGATPSRGDVVLAQYPSAWVDRGTNEPRVKRLIGLPGDTVQWDASEKTLTVGDETLKVEWCGRLIDETTTLNGFFLVGDNGAEGGSNDSRSRFCSGLDFQLPLTPSLSRVEEVSSCRLLYCGRRTQL